MRYWHLTLRIFRIIRTLIHYRLDQDLREQHLTLPLLFLRVLFFWQKRCSIALSPAERLRRALIELGPLFVKFGQMLSTRRDLLTPEYANALAELQDKVPPFDAALARQRIEASLEQPIEKLFKSFSELPLASASVAQVHAAELHTGEQVVVKIIRPRIRRQIAEDLRVLHWLAVRVERNHIDGPRLRPREVIRDYEHTLLDELDLRVEAANTSALKRNFDGSDLLYVPQVHWPFVRRNVLVMERIYGVPIGDVAALINAGVDMKELSSRGVQIFFTQVFRDRFFHADMHPGNIFVDVSDPKKPRYIAVDCAIMGSLSERDQLYLAENFVAFFNRDYRRVAELHLQSGWVPEGTSVEAFESAIRANCEPIFGKPLSEISFGAFLLSLFQTARRFNMSVQPQLVLLQKTLFYVEGLGRQLYPELDLWQTAKPYLESWSAERVSPRKVWTSLKRQAPTWLAKLPDLPNQMLSALEQQANRALLASQQWQQQRLQREQQFGRWQQLIGGLLLVGAGVLLPLKWPPLSIAVLAAAGVFMLFDGYRRQK